MTELILRIQYIIDNVPLTHSQRSEAIAYLSQIQSKFVELQSDVKELRNEIQTIKQGKK